MKPEGPGQVRLERLYDLEASRARLIKRRAAWAEQTGRDWADHMGRMPEAGLQPPEPAPVPASVPRDVTDVAREFAKLLAATPVRVEPWDPLPGVYVWNLFYRLGGAPLPGERYREGTDPDLRDRYAGLVSVNIGMPGHYIPDLAIGLAEGWGGTEARVSRARDGQTDPARRAYLDAALLLVQSCRDSIRNHARAARTAAHKATDLDAMRLESVAAQMEVIADAPPATFWQACLWIQFFMIFNRTYSGANSLGRLDKLLQDYYDRDCAAGVLTEAEASFLIEALLIHDTHFICIGGRDAAGRDECHAVSRLVLEAWGRVRGPANIGLRCSTAMPPALFRLATETLLKTGQGTPSLVNDDAVAPGLVRSGHTPEEAWSYAYGGCHWWQLPGRSYGLSDGTKVILPGLMHLALDRMMAGGERRIERLWTLLEEEFHGALKYAAQCYRLQLDCPGHVHPEIMQSLFSHGPVEQGLDLLNGSLPCYDFLADGLGLANAADGLVALETVIEKDKRFTWDEVHAALKAGFEGHEDIRRALDAAPKFGNDVPEADAAAVKVRDLFVAAARAARPADGRFRILAGFYSWLANVLAKGMAATADGRRAGVPFAHGANPMHGQARKGLTALVKSVAAIQTGTGASAPLHMELDPKAFAGEQGVELFGAFVRACFRMGISQINVNLVSRKVLEEAMADPAAHRDLSVRVTGFSAYFVNLNETLYPEILSRYDT